MDSKYQQEDEPEQSHGLSIGWHSDGPQFSRAGWASSKTLALRHFLSDCLRVGTVGIDAGFTDNAQCMRKRHCTNQY